MDTATATRYEIDVEDVEYIRHGNKVFLERFQAAYRKAGGRLEMHWFEGMSQAFMSEHPTSPATLEAIEKIAGFVHREAR